MRSREKVLAVFSACCIIIATFGFLSIPQFFDNSINKLKNENVDLRTRQDITLDLTSKANTYQDTARLQRDSLDLLEGMGAGPETLERKGRDVFNLYRISALDAGNAAARFQPPLGRVLRPRAELQARLAEPGFYPAIRKG